MTNLSIIDDIRAIYQKSFATVRAIVETFPEDKWLVPHSDEYYIPSRIAYHIATFISRHFAGGMNDPEFHAKLPYGYWMDATSETLPNKRDFLVYYNAIIEKAEETLAALGEDTIHEPSDPARAWIGESYIGILVYCLREIADHTGELNKMLVENGFDDIFIFK